MSQKYDFLPNTTYPDTIQTFEEKLNITPNDATLVKQMQQLIEQRKFSEANAIRKQIPNYTQKQIIAQDFNTVFDTAVALQLEYNNRYTPSYVLSKDKPTNQSEGDYWYRITDIKYIGETTEIGTGDKTPDNPYEIKGCTIPNINVELFQLPNEVADEYNENNKILIKRIKKVTLNSTVANVTKYNDKYFGVTFDDAKSYDDISIITSRFNQFPLAMANDKTLEIGVCTMANSNNLTVIFGINLDISEQEFIQWLDTHTTTLLYELKTPEIIQM